MNKIIAIFARLSGGKVILEKIALYRVQLIKIAAILAIAGAACSYASGVLTKAVNCGASLSCVIDVVRQIPDDIKNIVK